ncbi:MAG: autotransporter outer membrane beta-barrel domain-containing protein, partial [Phascolarctobacterium sp.]|nr:autotransporter outer membrane beta-barrel domain-containing protein [Phascolarctobacterium sp.]
SVKNQYNAYQLGYDQKTGDWTVGAAVTYTEGETSFAEGNGENDHTGLAVYGSKLNGDGSYIDLIAKYAKLDHEYTVGGGIGSGEYDTDGFALSAEYGKRFEQGNGLWIEPQVELTYGLVDSVGFAAENGRVSLDDMNSLVGRVGFRAGKDIKDGNVYVRASYLYDFEGETDIAFTDGVDTRSFKQDLGGGWWEFGIGTNINLSKATYIYADVEHACGGEVDTDWQWNLGVRYSF